MYCSLSMTVLSHPPSSWDSRGRLHERWQEMWLISKNAVRTRRIISGYGKVYYFVTPALFGHLSGKLLELFERKLSSLHNLQTTFTSSTATNEKAWLADSERVIELTTDVFTRPPSSQREAGRLVTMASYWYRPLQTGLEKFSVCGNGDYPAGKGVRRVAADMEEYELQPPLQRDAGHSWCVGWTPTYT